MSVKKKDSVFGALRFFVVFLCTLFVAIELSLSLHTAHTSTAHTSTARGPKVEYFVSLS